MGTFEIVERKGPMAYKLALPDSLRHMHDVFHVSVLRHYISDPTVDTERGVNQYQVQF
jgi:hypothetical protein